MGSYEKLTNNQLNRLKFVAQNKTGTSLIITNTNSEDEEMAQDKKPK